MTVGDPESLLPQALSVADGRHESERLGPALGLLSKLVRRFGWGVVAGLSTLALGLAALVEIAVLYALAEASGTIQLLHIMGAGGMALLLAVPSLAMALRLIDKLGRTRELLLEEIDRRRIAEQQLRRLATTDELTGLGNRRYFVDRAREALAVAGRYDQWCTVCAIDIDHFKRLNDRLGHQAGDRALVGLAAILRANLRAADLAVRFGGDEFLVLMPFTDPEAGQLAATRLQLAVREDGADYDLRISVGVATIRGGQASLEELLASADQALYDAKRSGRDRVVVHGGRQSESEKRPHAIAC